MAYSSGGSKKQVIIKSNLNHLTDWLILFIYFFL